MQLLFVENNLVVQKLCHRIGQRLGCEVVAIGSGTAALDHLATAPTLPHIIFIKTSLPGMSGYDLVRIIRTQPPFCNDLQLQTIPLIGLTASASGTNLSRERATGYNDFLRAPLRVSTLGETIGHWTRRQIMGPADVPAWQMKAWHRLHRGPRSRL